LLEATDSLEALVAACRGDVRCVVGVDRPDGLQVCGGGSMAGWTAGRGCVWGKGGKALACPERGERRWHAQKGGKGVGMPSQTLLIHDELPAVALQLLARALLAGMLGWAGLRCKLCCGVRCREP
jgi:hypothetical protein